MSAQLGVAALSGRNLNMRKGPPRSNIRKGCISAPSDVTKGHVASLVCFRLKLSCCRHLRHAHDAAQGSRTSFNLLGY